MSRPPRVSVLVPAYYSHGTLPTFLDALSAQTYRDFELILVDSTPQDLLAPLVRGRPGRIQLVRHPHRLLPHEARNEAALRAGGAILVFTDPDCRAEPDWLERLVYWHDRGREAVGGAVAHESGWWNASVHLAKYPWWLPGGECGERPEIPSANASFSRRIWTAAGPFRGDRFAGDSLFSWRVRAGGDTIWFDPRAIVTHLDHVGPGAFVRERFRRGVDFGLARGPTLGWRRPGYVARLAAAPAAPLVMTARAGRYALRAGQAAAWAAALPVQLLGNGLWCAGEWLSHARLALAPHANGSSAPPPA